MDFTRGTGFIPIVVESCGYEGVKRIADKVAEDIHKVVGERAQVITEAEVSMGGYKSAILCATLGKSLLLNKLSEKGLIDLESFYREGEEHTLKREVYQIKLLSHAIEGVEELLLICGSDKRGTIYGMFSLSEYIGVSPLCYWGDAEPLQRESIVIGKDIEKISKEPSVKYRGFFINDEWPCFGKWVNEHFGGFNADAYDRVFELLLRMKGNYLWPAMWSASFPLDGPGSANEELADLYGVVMGYSHHEPCLRASEEWKKVCGPGSRYGDAWNFYTNEQGLLNYWEDALKRSGKYENMITIGMRGEYDSSMLGPDATVTENVNLLKRIITKQKELIGRYVDREGQEVPLLLALYKEVEAYYYGDEQTPGLKDWEGLSGVTCMLCEDNFGQMRTLPTEEIRDRKGGFGMYYHFDYHGGPISYEWVDSTPLSKTWEQMCQAYEYGVRDVWIVNVGDLKFHEVPLSYFMALAYDYEKWGYGNPDSYREYTQRIVQQNFPATASNVQEKIETVLTDYIAINALRRPEALHAGVYHPCHYGETDHMLELAMQVENTSKDVLETLSGNERNAYYSMIHYPAMASMNLLKMHLYAGKNHHYASQGRPVANDYGRLTEECIQRDRDLADQWAAFLDGKWDGMQIAQHIGFTKWNEDDYRYPIVMKVEPAHMPRLSVSRQDEERLGVKNYGEPMVIMVPDFQYMGCEEVKLEIVNSGTGALQYQITVDADSPAGQKSNTLPEWLSVTPMSGKVEKLQEVTLRCIREKLPESLRQVSLLITDGDTTVAVLVQGRVVDTADLPERTFLQRNGVISIGAEHYAKKNDTAKGSFEIISDYGKYGAAVKVFPSTATFDEAEEKPEVTYRFYLEEDSDYQIELITAPTNSVVNCQGIHLMATVREFQPKTGASKVSERKVELLPADFRAGESSDSRWALGVLNQERRCSVVLPLNQGVQELSIGVMEPGVVLEKILIYKSSISLLESYLGPAESYMTGAGDLINVMPSERRG